VERFDELLSEYLDGTLDAAGRAELASLVEADPARRDEFVSLLREHRILSQELADPAADAFVRRVMAEIDKGRTQFVRSVMADVRGPGSGSRRPSPRRPRSGGSRTPGWVLWASLAAGLFVIVAILLSATGGEEPTRPRIVKKPKPPVIEAPAPKIEPPKEEPAPPPPLPKPTPRTADPIVPPTPPPVPKPEPEPVPPPKPAPPPPEKPPVTVTEVATLEAVEGDVTPKAGPLTPGFVIETKTEKSSAVLRYPDGTRVEVGGLTKVQHEAARPGQVLTLSGVVTADVAKQPADKPMLFLTAHAEARILGTRLKVETIGDATRLDVTEGRVRLTRLKDKASVEVGAGHYAVAAPAGAMTSKLVRASAGLVALYTFKEGKGGVVSDVSRVGAPLDLRIENEAAVKWTAKGLFVTAPTLIDSAAPATKISQACKGTNELTIEAWVRPGVLAPPVKDCRLVTMSADTLNQNFMLGQYELNGPAKAYFSRLRTTTTDPVGKPALVAPDNTVALKLMHVVYTRNASGLATIYVDGVDVARGVGGGNLSTWNDGYRLALAGEFGADRSWLGEYHLVAIYARALTVDDVKQNLKAGAE